MSVLWETGESLPPSRQQTAAVYVCQSVYHILTMGENNNINREAVRENETQPRTHKAIISSYPLDNRAVLRLSDCASVMWCNVIYLVCSYNNCDQETLNTHTCTPHPDTGGQIQEEIIGLEQLL